MHRHMYQLQRQKKKKMTCDTNVSAPNMFSVLNQDDLDFTLKTHLV